MGERSKQETMNVLEVYSQGKRGVPELCEDGYVVTADFAAVVDGSTSKRSKAFSDGKSFNGALSEASPSGGGLEGAEESLEGTETSGHLAKRIALAAIKTLPTTADVAEAVQAITTALRMQWHTGAEFDAALRPTCSAVIFSRTRREVWMIGDCQCRFLGATYTNPKLVDSILARTRSEVLHYLLVHGHSVESLRHYDIGRAIIYDALREQTNFQNDPNLCNPYRYAVLDGSEVDLRLVRVLPLGSASQLILASDGYPILSDTLTESEAALSRLLRQDPLCIDDFAATKGLMDGNCSFDDRTFLRLSIPLS